MIKSYGNEFVAVRVQDPRIQNQGFWNSYVDFKIFLHTNSKAFTAKTSCVRRRYSEFVWLKKKMQKNCGLVPVPDLPSKSFFSFSNEEFLEKRRKGLQSFLEKVLHMTVCLSDSQLHLFLQTQLPVGHIQDCVQGHTPYTVTDAILTYASSNQGWTQEEDGIQERTPTPVPYESMESPAPHLPTLPSGVLLDPVSLTSIDPEDLPTEEAIAEINDLDTLELQYEETESPSLTALQDNNYGESVLEINSPVEATSVGDSQVESSPVEPNVEGETHQGVSQQQTCVEVHCTEEEECLMSVEKEHEEEHSVDDSEQTVPHTQSLCELISHEVECQRESVEQAVQDPVSQVNLAQLDSRQEQNISGKDTNKTAQLDDSHEVSETGSQAEIRYEEDHDVDTDLEMTKAQGAIQETDIVEVDSDGEILLCEEQDPDMQIHGETPADESRVGDSRTGEASPVETSHMTNGYKETAEDKHIDVDNTQAAAHDTDTLKVEANVDPSPQEYFNKANCIQEKIIFVEGREDEEMPYMTNVGSATTLEEVSSGLEDSVEEPLNHEVQRNHHLESSGDHCPEEAILLAVDLDCKDSIKSHERNVHESTADANLTVDQEKEP